MINCKVTRNGRESEIRFPCTEKDIWRVQHELEIPYETDTRVKVLGVDSDIEQLEILEGQNENLDFLNLLGRLMYGMDAHEFEQFRIGLYHEGFTNLRDIINVSQSVRRYSIINPNDLSGSGLDHEMDIRVCIPTKEVETTDYSTIGKELLDSGKCEETPYGLLYVNEEIPIDNFFDGRHMPAYFDRDFQIAAFLKNDTDEDFVLLPCFDEELQRAANRLNSSFPYDLKVSIDLIKNNDEAVLSELVNSADICTLNDFAHLMNGFDTKETEKYLASLRYVKQHLGSIGNLRNAIRLGYSQEAFSFYPNVMCNEDLGYTLLEEHDVPEELWEYFDVERYGEEMCEQEFGEMSDNGYIGINDYTTVSHCLTQNHEMGGMI